MTYKHGFRREPSSDGPKGETGSAGRMLISGWGSSLFLRTFPVIFFEFIQIFFFFQSDNFSATLDLSEMSLVVEQTLPYTATELKLEDPKRWSRLFPLIRPSVKTVEASNGHTLVVIDTALTGSKNALFTAIGTVGRFSSTILSESHLAAFATEQTSQSIISAEEIQTILKHNGFPIHNGVVVVRSGSKQNLRTSHKVIELSLEGELKLNHVLSLLSAIKPEIK